MFSELPIQKVLHFHLAKEKKNFKLASNYAIMEKLDGWFVYLEILAGQVIGFKASSGRIIPSLNYLLPKVKQLTNFTNFTNANIRIIFEATIPGLSFHETNGILNRKYEPAEKVLLNFHDLIDLNQPKIPFLNRYRTFERYFQTQLAVILQEQFTLIPILEITSDENLIYSHFNDIIAKNGEGIILKNIDAGYSFGKRNMDVMKIKEEITEDLEVIGLVEGEGKYRDTTGALKLVRSNGAEVLVSGMTDKEREEWWENPSSIIGKFVEVKAMKELPDGTLREPRFKAVRYDKTN